MVVCLSSPNNLFCITQVHPYILCTQVTTTITIPEGAGAKTTAGVVASPVHVETSEIQEVANVTTTAI